MNAYDSGLSGPRQQNSTITRWRLGNTPGVTILYHEYEYCRYEYWILVVSLRHTTTRLPILIYTYREKYKNKQWVFIFIIIKQNKITGRLLDMLLHWLFTDPLRTVGLAALTTSTRVSTALVVVTVGRVMFLSLICRNASHAPVSRRSPIFGGAVTPAGLSLPCCLARDVVIVHSWPPHILFGSDPSRGVCSMLCVCLLSILSVCPLLLLSALPVPVDCHCCREKGKRNEFPRGKLPKTTVVNTNTTGYTRHPEAKNTKSC